MGVLGTVAGWAVGGPVGGYLGHKIQEGEMGGAGKWLFGDQAAKDKALAEENFQLQGGDMLRGYAEQQMQGAQGRQAPTAQAAQLDPAAQMQAAQLQGGQQDQFRAMQLAQAQQLAGIAGGQQMGAGEMAVRRQANQQAAHLMGQTQMARGSNAGIMARAAARGLGGLGVNAAGAAGQAAMQDQGQARGQLAGLMGQARGADLDLASQNAQLLQQGSLQNAQLQQQRMLQQGQFGQQTNLANQQAALQQRGLNDAYSQNMFGNYLNTSDAEMRARMARAGMLSGDHGNLGAILSAAGPVVAAAV